MIDDGKQWHEDRKGVEKRMACWFSLSCWFQPAPQFSCIPASVQSALQLLVQACSVSLAAGFSLLFRSLLFSFPFVCFLSCRLQDALQLLSCRLQSAVQLPVTAKTGSSLLFGCLLQQRLVPVCCLAACYSKDWFQSAVWLPVTAKTGSAACYSKDWFQSAVWLPVTAKTGSSLLFGCLLQQRLVPVCCLAASVPAPWCFLAACSSQLFRCLFAGRHCLLRLSLAAWSTESALSSGCLIGQSAQS